MLKERAWESIKSFVEEKGDWLALLGASLYALQLFLYAHTTFSRLDESAYLYKGYLFATGQYEPFGAGLWTNKAPLAFLIPGYIQAWFGPGLRTGRYFAVFLAVFMLLGVWITARRLGNKSWGAGVVWLFALSTSLLIVYSLAISQVLIASMLTWALALSLGGDRKLWQIILSATLAGLIILTRQNMVMVLPILLLYIFWQYGWKTGLLASIVGVGVVGLGHAIWWPDILSLWAPWLPSPISDFLQSFYLPDVIANSSGQALGSSSGSFSPKIHSRILSFFRTFRYRLPIHLGFIVSLFLWSPKKQSSGRRKDAIFLLVLFSVLAGMHAWASLGKSYCVYCWSLYLSFFNVSAIFFIIITAPTWKKKLPNYLIPILFLLFLVLATGMGYSSFEEIGETLYEIPVPRVKNLQVHAGSVEAGTLFSNKFGVPHREVREYLSVLFGFGIGLSYLLFFLITYFVFLRKKNINIAYAGLMGFLAISLLSFPFITLAERTSLNNGNVILAHEKAGAYLAKYISEGSTVYWHGGTSLVPLMYIPGGVHIYATQLNAYNNHRIGGDDEILLSFGFWNWSLDKKWKEEADYIVLINYLYTGEWNAYLTPDKYEEFPRSSVLLDDREDSFLRVFRKK